MSGRRHDPASVAPKPATGPTEADRSSYEVLFDSAAVGLTRISLDGRFLIVNDALCRLLGHPRDVLLGLGVADVTFHADLQPSLEAVARTVKTGETTGLDKRYVRPDGRIVWAHSSLTPLRDASGEVETLLVVVTDLTARHEAEEALRRSEQRLRLALQAGNFATWDWNMLSGSVIWSDEVFRMHGLEVGTIQPSLEFWWSTVHPEDRPEVEAMLAAARDGHQPFEAEFRIRRLDGDIAWCASTGMFFYDDVGAPFRMIGLQRDVTQRHEWQGRQQVLIAELQHRTRNLLGVVRSLAERTSSGVTSIKDFMLLFRERLAALARVNGLLSRLDEGQRITFDELLRSELSAGGVVGGDWIGKLALDGPSGVRLRSATVQTFALALHELTTNAVKYGALAAPEGQLSVRWGVERDGHGEARLRVDWHESGVPDVPADDALPRGGGYGRELIERALPYQLKARTSYELTADGVRCTIDLPLCG